MKLLKQNVIRTFLVFMVLVSIAYGAFGYLGGNILQEQKSMLDNLNWSMEPTGDYDYLEAAEEENRFLADAVTEKHILDPTGKVIGKLPGGYDLGHGFYEYEKDGAYGVSDKDGKVLIKPEYASVESEGSYFITYKEEMGIALWDLTGTYIYEEPKPAQAIYIGKDVFLVNLEKELKSYILYADTLQTKPLENYLEWVTSDDNGGLMGQHDGLYYRLDENFDLVKDGPVYQDYGELSEGLRYVTIYDRDSNKTVPVTPCYIDIDGEIVIRLEGKVPDVAGPFREGKALIQKGGKLVCIDKTGRELFALKMERSSSTFQIYDDFYYSEGYAAVSLDGDKYGYIDETGAFVVPAVLDSAQEVRNGYAAAAIYGKDMQYGVLQFD